MVGVPIGESRSLPDIIRICRGLVQNERTVLSELYEAYKKESLPAYYTVEDIPYNLFSANCEDLASYIKTGSWVSGQVVQAKSVVLDFASFY